MKTLTLATTVALLATLCSVGMSQRPIDQRGNDRDQLDRIQRQQPRAEQVRQGNQSNQSDESLVNYFAGKLMLMNDSTIRMSQLAQQKASSSEVKQFAQKLVEGHQQLNQKLRECAPDVASFAASDQGRRHTVGFRGTEKANAQEANNGRPQADRRDDLRRETLARTDRTATASHRASGLVGQILIVEREAAENYIESSTRMLGRYEGQDFDMGYLGFQIGSHTWALAELKAMQKKSVGDEKFQQLVGNATDSIEQHLQQAKQLAKKFEDDRSRNRTGRDSLQRSDARR